MEYRLIYIDDDLGNASIFKDGLITNKLLDVTVIKADDFEKQLKEIIKIQKDFDGIILDLKLDENQKGERKAFYTAPALAQQLRSKSIDKKNGFKEEFPIFLLTSKTKLIKYYTSDKVSHDLFDRCYIKEPNFGESGKLFEKEIHSFILAYKTIKKAKNFYDLLGIEDSNIIKIVFEYTFKGSLVADKAKFIYKKIIKKSGILIDDKILAARLGIDLQKSSDWELLKKKLRKIQYSGIYGDCFERWWMHLLNEWWKKNISSINLASLAAKERVDLLKKSLKIKNLKDAKLIPKTSSTRYWTICQSLLRPIDPDDGFRLRKSNPESWQDMEYITLESYFEGKIKPQDIHPIEIERFKDVKSQFKK